MEVFRFFLQYLIIAYITIPTMELHIIQESKWCIWSSELVYWRLVFYLISGEEKMNDIKLKHFLFKAIRNMKEKINAIRKRL